MSCSPLGPSGALWARAGPSHMPLQVKLEVDKAGDVLWLVQQQYKIQILLFFPSHSAGSWH